MMDSLTRVAMAQREIGLSAGEPPATRGYPPSTFAVLAQLLERAGSGTDGTVTGVYTVLVEGDDHDEPIADAARSLLDGHVVLRRDIAISGRYPAVDALASISRLAGKVLPAERRGAAAALRAVLAARESARDLIDVGAYRPGANALVDRALAHEDAIAGFLGQGLDEVVPAEASWRTLAELVAVLDATPAAELKEAA
jgi:flagellum-specific ATP synthase